jgi:hypothetical protein
MFRLDRTRRGMTVTEARSKARIMLGRIEANVWTHSRRMRTKRPNGRAAGYRDRVQTDRHPQVIATKMVPAMRRLVEAQRLLEPRSRARVYS